MPCDLYSDQRIHLQKNSFNPCWVFWCLATECCRPVNTVYFVSIPVGFSDALRHFYFAWYLSHFYVSIPVGFSDALRQYYWQLACQVSYMFQSLLGFLMHCDNRRWAVFNNHNCVSIPVGFSDALRPARLHKPHCFWCCFNPCWVFWCIATLQFENMYAYNT